jgi:DNA-binding MarR family transcriptional regulator
MKSDYGYGLINQILATSGALLQESHRFFRPLGITEVQFNVLNVLSENAEGMSQRELSDVLVVDRSNVTTLLDRMEKAGWVRRTDHPTDRRVYRVTLTSAGKKLQARVMPLYLQAIEEIVADLSASEVKQVITGLDALKRGVARWAAKKS